LMRKAVAAYVALREEEKNPETTSATATKDNAEEEIDDSNKIEDSNRQEEIDDSNKIDDHHKEEEIDDSNKIDHHKTEDEIEDSNRQEEDDDNDHDLKTKTAADSLLLDTSRHSVVSTASTIDSTLGTTPPVSAKNMMTPTLPTMLTLTSPSKKKDSSSIVNSVFSGAPYTTPFAGPRTPDGRRRPRAVAGDSKLGRHSVALDTLGSSYHIETSNSSPPARAHSLKRTNSADLEHMKTTAANNQSNVEKSERTERTLMRTNSGHCKVKRKPRKTKNKKKGNENEEEPSPKTPRRRLKKDRARSKSPTPTRSAIVGGGGQESDDFVSPKTARKKKSSRSSNVRELSEQENHSPIDIKPKKTRSSSLGRRTSQKSPSSDRRSISHIATPNHHNKKASAAALMRHSISAPPVTPGTPGTKSKKKRISSIKQRPSSLKGLSVSEHAAPILRHSISSPSPSTPGGRRSTSKSPKKKRSIKRPSSLKGLSVSEHGAPGVVTETPTRKPRRGTKRPESLKLSVKNNFTDNDGGTTSKPSSSRTDTESSSADIHDDEIDDDDVEKPKSFSGSEKRKSLIGAIKKSPKRFSKSLSSKSHSMLSTITNKMKTGFHHNNNGNNEKHQQKGEEHDDEDTSSSDQSIFSFRDLPTEVKQKVAFFLPIGDVMNLVATSKSMQSEMDLEILSSPLTDSDSQNKVYRTGMGTKCIVAVVPNPEASLHTMTFTCDVRVGLRPFGKVWVVEQDLPVDQDPETLEGLGFHDGKVLTKSASLDKDTDHLSLTFPVRREKMYQLYARSRIHLHLENMTLQRACFQAKTHDYVAYQFDAMVK